MVFYFTATGNSLFVAKQLDANPISIPQVKDGFVFEDETIGIVCPVYCGEIPKIVFDFLARSEFKTGYFYCILTFGMDESDSAEYTFRQCQKEGVIFDYIACVKMVDNYLPSFDMKEEKQIDKGVEAQLDGILSDIRSRKKQIPTATKAGRKLHRTVAVMNKLCPSLNNGSALTVTDGCIGCGVCTKVCPVGNIAINSGHAQRLNKTCAFCLACIQNCPSNAIRLKNERNPEERYRNPQITLAEIIRANDQHAKEGAK